MYLLIQDPKLQGKFADHLLAESMPSISKPTFAAEVSAALRCTPPPTLDVKGSAFDFCVLYGINE